MFNARYSFTICWRIIIITNYYFYVSLFDCCIFFVMEVNSEVNVISVACVCAQLLIFMQEGYQHVHLRIYNLNPQYCIKSCVDHATCVIILGQGLIDWFETLKEYFLFFQEEIPQKVDVLQNVKGLYMLQWLYNFICKIPKMCALL